MIERPGSLVQAARRVLPSLVIFALAAGVVLLLVSLNVPLGDAGAGNNYGAFVIGIAGALLFTRLLDFTVFDVGFRLRRRAAAPALLRQLVGLLVFGLLIAVLSQVILSANLTLLLTSSAIITAVIGLALQETLGNLFSGLALALERTVQVGDLVRTGETIGLVEQLSWRAIKVRTMEGSSILVPNSVASRERMEVFRRGGPPIARVLRVGLEYDTSPAQARAALEAALRDVSGVAAHPAPVAYLKSFDDHAVSYELRYWPEDYARYLEVDSRVRERIWYRLARERIKIAYPVIRQHQYAAGPLLAAPEIGPIPEVIAASDLFAPLSAAEQAQLAQGATVHRFAEGEVIVREGDPTSSMFLIADGRVSVSAKGDTGPTQKLALLEAGSTFGEISLLTGEPRIASVRAMSEATLIEIGKATLAPILEANPDLVEKLDAIILERRRERDDRLVSARESSAAEPSSLRGRIARFFGLSGVS
ncbi:MAG: mechanosensitive ion channel family protein [Acidobacteriota bacterium]